MQLYWKLIEAAEACERAGLTATAAGIYHTASIATTDAHAKADCLAAQKRLGEQSK
jgi:hypothetical protein